jgi:hypothetical protein
MDLSKREYFVLEIFCAIMENGYLSHKEGITRAIEIADALLDALDNREKKSPEEGIAPKTVATQELTEIRSISGTILPEGERRCTAR